MSGCMAQEWRDSGVAYMRSNSGLNSSSTRCRFSSAISTTILVPLYVPSRLVDSRLVDRLRHLPSLGRGPRVRGKKGSLPEAEVSRRVAVSSVMAAVTEPPADLKSARGPVHAS